MKKSTIKYVPYENGRGFVTADDDFPVDAKDRTNSIFRVDVLLAQSVLSIEQR